MPWFTVSSTFMSTEDAESIKDYIISRGSFNDVMIPTMFIKCLMDVKTLKLFMPILTKEIEVDKAGSTSLKHARVRWAIPKLEFLAVKYMLNKCHFYTA